MASDAANSVEYWASIPARYAPALYTLRKWPQLKMATEEELIWLRGFSEADVASTEVLSIPLLERYYLKEMHLYPIGKFLPVRVEPGLLWTDLRRGLKISLPKENFNYFGVAGEHRISLVRSEVQRATTATIIDLTSLGKYLHTAPWVRVAPLQWTIIEGKQALIIGTPLLPIRGDDYYQKGCFLLPTGWKLRYERMVDVYQKALADSRDYWYILGERGILSKLRKADLNHLSKGSFINSGQL